MTQTTTATPPSIQEIRVKDLQAHPQNRKHFDPTKMVELTANVAKEGVLVPALVRPIGANQFQLIAGERRWRAAKGAKLLVMPCIVREMTDEEALEKLMMDNLQREDPHPLEEADTYAAWLELPGHDVAGLAAKIGKGANHIYSRLQLRRLIEPAREQMWAGQLPIGHAQLIARLEPSDQEEALRLVKMQTGWNSSTSLRSLSDFTRVLVKFDLELKGAPFPLADATICPGAGACQTCPKRTGFTDGMFPELAAALAPVTVDPDSTDTDEKAVPDTCLDAACWKSKEAAWVERQLAETREKYGEVYSLTTRSSERWPNNKKTPVPHGVWKRSKEGTKGAVPGVIVAVPSAMMQPPPKLGEVLWVTLKARPKVEAPSATKESPKAASQESQRAENVKKMNEWEKREIPRRLVLARAVVTAVKDKVIVPLLAEYIRSHGNDVSVGVRALGLPAKLDGDLKKLNAQEIQQVLVLDMIGDDLEPYQMEKGFGRGLEEAAALVGIDAKKIVGAFDAAVKKGIRGMCSKCCCTEDRACETEDGPCGWANKEQTLCTACVPTPKPAKGGK